MTPKVIWMALVIALSMTAWLTTTQAQEDSDCRAACQAQHERCVEVCSVHSDPVECDANCRNEMEDCEARCE